MYTIIIFYYWVLWQIHYNLPIHLPTYTPIFLPEKYYEQCSLVGYPRRVEMGLTYTHTHTYTYTYNTWGFSDDSYGKECTCNAGDPHSVPESGRSLGEGNGYPPHYSCLENSMDRGAWQATVHGVTKSQTWLRK